MCDIISDRSLTDFYRLIKKIIYQASRTILSLCVSPQGGSKAAMADAVQLSSQSQVHVTQLFEDKRPVLTSQPNGLAPLGSTRQGLPPADRQTSASEPTHHCRQSSAASNKSSDGKPKPASMTPEQAMKQFMSKMSSFEHHEVFTFPEGEWTTIRHAISREN